MIRSLLIANRGEIARRVIRTARRMGIRSVAVFTEADRSWPHWREADDAVLIGQGPAAESYLSVEAIVAAARKAGADAVHPGYGFLSENADFADACAEAGLIFVGPPAAAIRAMGSKAEAKAIMARAGVPVVPGFSGERQDPDFLKQKAYEIGYPVLVKAVAGGGGRGMRRVDRALDFETALAAAKREALAAFGDERVILERYLAQARHIEVQVFADTQGGVVHLFERDCSVQRRHQKVVEEAPAPGLLPQTREAMGKAAIQAAAAVGYVGAGTVEFIAEAAGGFVGSFFFMEMNTRLQVEHPVTEQVTGLDLVEWQLRIAAGEPLPMRQDEIRLEGHSVEARLYAEDPAAGFRPSTGRIWAASFPDGPGLRVDTGVEEGSVVGSLYDPMLAKVIATGEDRAEAVQRLSDALVKTRIAGPRTNLAFLSALANHPEFLSGGMDTGFLDRQLDQLIGEPPPPGLAAAPILEWSKQEAGRCAAMVRGPWARADAFELAGQERRTSIAVELEGVPYTAELDWTPAGPRHVSPEFASAETEGVETLWAERDAFVSSSGGQQMRVTFPDPLARTDTSQNTGGGVLAPMNGRVVTVSVTLGEQVAKGTPLFTLEAMKMEHAVLAPLDGTVRALRIHPGAQLEQGATAMTIEPREAVGKEPVE
jgi:3-methylcrotonyl-CoA carboxylase alpha subunit